MPYATFAMLADAPGARELAEVATPEHVELCLKYGIANDEGVSSVVFIGF